MAKSEHLSECLCLDNQVWIVNFLSSYETRFLSVRKPLVMSINGTYGKDIGVKFP